MSNRVPFLSVGGMKVFRDDMWGRLRFPFQADHKFYKEHGLYDFPQKDYKARIISRILILLTKIPSMRKEIYQKRMKSEMIQTFSKNTGGTESEGIGWSFLRMHQDSIFRKETDAFQ